jgi:esterase/lipase
VILIHGFTAHGKYLKKLGSFIQALGYKAFIYNYNSYRGIYKASESLRDYLMRYDRMSGGAITENRLFLIAHSMGGLVARLLAINHETAGMIRGIIMLGTPNNGCFPSTRWLSHFIQYGEYLSEVMPEASNPACLSAKELVKADTTTTRPLIDSLNEIWSTSPACPPTMTISGGKRHLAISKSMLKNWIANKQIQAEMKDEENDGLVTERSVNMHKSTLISTHHKYTHFNSYPYYYDLNHTNLKENQTLALEIVEWLNSF